MTSGSGNSQTIALPASIFRYNADSVVKSWQFTTGVYPSVDAALTGTSSTTFVSLGIFGADGRVEVLLGAGDQEHPRRDFSSDVELNGSFTLASGSHSVTFGIYGRDTSERYSWIPSNAAEVIAFYNAISGSNVAATLTIRDFTPVTTTRARIVGTPTEAGTGNIVVRATDAFGFADWTLPFEVLRTYIGAINRFKFSRMGIGPMKVTA